MAEPPAAIRSRVLWAALCAAGLVVFALGVHRGWPWIGLAAAGLLLASVAVEQCLHASGAPLELLGLARARGCEGVGTDPGALDRQEQTPGIDRPLLGLPTTPAPGTDHDPCTGATRHSPLFVVVFAAGAAVLGAALAAAYRRHFGAPLLPPGGVHPFVIVACLVGVMEELVYRGCIQGSLSRLGSPAAIVLAAGAHTAYKTALFVFPPAPMHVDFGFIVACTFLGGCVFGAARQIAGSVWPCLAAHAAFDLVAYAAATGAPWWVWT